jgi:hypothetical protein
MRYLLNYKSFSINEEAELKHSVEIANQVKKLYDEVVSEIDMMKFNGDSGEKIDKDDDDEMKKILDNRDTKSIKSKINEIIYPKFLIQLGAAILSRGSEIDYKMFKDFKFIELIKKSITDKNTENLQQYIDRGELRVLFLPFSISTKDGNIRFGSMGTSGESNRYVFNAKLKLNVYDNEKIRDEIEETVRHELQHLTQILNSYCLEIGKMVKKNVDVLTKESFPEEVRKIFISAIKSGKFGSGKTKTGLDQNSDLTGNFDDQTGKKTKLGQQFSAVYSKSRDLSSKEEENLAKELQYLGDDQEYKPWITDKVDSFLKKELVKKLLDILKKRPELIIEKNSVDTKFSYSSEVEKQFNDIFNNLESNKKISIGDLTSIIIKMFINTDRELMIIKKMRKETTNDIYKLISGRLKKMLVK